MDMKTIKKKLASSAVGIAFVANLAALLACDGTREDVNDEVIANSLPCGATDTECIERVTSGTDTSAFNEDRPFELLRLGDLQCESETPSIVNPNANLGRPFVVSFNALVGDLAVDLTPICTDEPVGFAANYCNASRVPSQGFQDQWIWGNTDFVIDIFSEAFDIPALEPCECFSTVQVVPDFPPATAGGTFASGNWRLDSVQGLWTTPLRFFVNPADALACN